MANEKPFGWLPITDEHREMLRSDGWTEEAIAKLEERNTYSPDPTAIVAWGIVRSLVRVLGKRFGPELVDELKADFAAHADTLANEGTVEGQVEAAIMRDAFGDEGWPSADDLQ